MNLKTELQNVTDMADISMKNIGKLGVKSAEHHKVFVKLSSSGLNFTNFDVVLYSNQQ